MRKCFGSRKEIYSDTFSDWNVEKDLKQAKINPVVIRKVQKIISEQLSIREKHILYLRFFKHLSLTDCTKIPFKDKTGKKIFLSPGCVSTFYCRALDKFRMAFKDKEWKFFL